MTKDQLLEQITTDRRQLERYLFYFERDQHGEFSASRRLKIKPADLESHPIYQDWSINDLLAHLSGWERFFLEWFDHQKYGKTCSNFSADASWDDEDAINQLIFSRSENKTFEEVLEDFWSTHQQIVALIDSLSEEELFNPQYFSWTGDSSLEDYLSHVTWQHYRWAKVLIRSWSRTGGRRGTSKESILSNIQMERRRLEKNLASLSDEQMIEPGVIGEWSVKDILAHLVDWEQRFLAWYQAGLRGEIPYTPAPGMTWADLDKLNQSIYEQNRDRPLSRVQADFASSYIHVLETVKSIPEEDMFPAGRFAWTGNGNLAGYILANTANHYRWAKTQIRKWIREQIE